MVRRETANVLLVLVGGALVKLAVTDAYLRYVKPSARLWVLAAGVVMILLAVSGIVRDAVAGHAAHRADDGHGHQHGSRSVLLLVLPVLAIFLVAPPGLGADAVLRADGRGGAAVVARRDAVFAPLPAGAVAPISVSEFVTRSVWDASGSLAGRTVRLTGFVVRDRGALYVARLVITCCAADATPMKVALVGGQLDGLVDDQWIAVDGRLRPGSATPADEYTPTLLVSAVRVIAAPPDPYEY